MTIEKIDYSQIDLHQQYMPTILQFELPPGSVTIAEALTLVYVWDQSTIPEELICHFEQNSKRYPNEEGRSALLQIIAEYNAIDPYAASRPTLQETQEKIIYALLTAMGVSREYIMENTEEYINRFSAISTAGSDAFLQHHIFDPQQ